MSNEMNTEQQPEQSEQFGDATELIAMQKDMFEKAQADTVPFLSMVVEQEGDQYKATASGAHFDGQKALFFIQWMANQFNLSLAAVVNAVEVERGKQVQAMTDAFHKRISDTAKNADVLPIPNMPPPNVKGNPNA